MSVISDPTLAGTPGRNDLVAGARIAPAVREGAGDPWQRRRADGTWEARHPEPATPAAAVAEEPALA